MANNKIKTFTVRSEDGSVTDELPIGADAKDIDLSNGENLQTVLGDVSIQQGSINERLNKLELTDYLEFEISSNITREIEIPENTLYIANIRNGEKVLLVTSKGFSEVLSTDSTYNFNITFLNRVATFQTDCMSGSSKVTLKKLT